MRTRTKIWSVTISSKTGAIFCLARPYGRITQWYDAIDLENKQGIINTEESKRLAGKLNLKSFESDYKVVIIWQPEKMNDVAANKLLKLLEEPPPNTIFMLAGENPDQLLTTVRSRCAQVKIPRISDTSINAALSKSIMQSRKRSRDSEACFGQLSERHGNPFGSRGIG